MIGMAIAQRLNSEGKVGATHMGTGFDAWYAGYIDYNPVFKNIPAFWTETQGTRAGAAHVRARTGSGQHAPPAGAVRQPVARRHVAAARRRRVHGNGVDGDDRLRVEVQGHAALRRAISPAAIRSRAGAAKRRTRISCRRTQRDPAAAVEMLRRLAFSGVRVSQLTAPVEAEGETFPAGTWVVPTDQEFAALAREVLDAAEVSGDSRVRRAARSISRTTRPAGRCRCRWACAPSLATKPLDDGRAREDEAARAGLRSGREACAVQQRGGRSMPRRSTPRRASASMRIRSRTPSSRRPGASPAPARRWP